MHHNEYEKLVASMLALIAVIGAFVFIYRVEGERAVDAADSYMAAGLTSPDRAGCSYAFDRKELLELGTKYNGYSSSTGVVYRVRCGDVRKQVVVICHGSICESSGW